VGTCRSPSGSISVHTYSSPDRNAELMPANDGVASSEKFVREPLALPAVGTVAVQDERSIFRPLDQAIDPRNIRHVGRQGDPRLRSNLAVRCPGSAE